MEVTEQTQSRSSVRSHGEARGRTGTVGEYLFARWLAYRLAQVTAVATVVLIVAGGLVTHTGSALAVPDWPTTFGHNMFLFPWAGMVGGVFYEHSHRLLGSLVGMLTLGVGAALWPLGGRHRLAGVVAVVAVVVQGVLGGLRVVLLQDTLAIVHGCLAQAFVALIVGIALATSPHAERSAPVADRSLQALTVASAGLVYLQIVFGALLTHEGWIALHLAGAVAVFAVMPIVTARLRRAGHAGSLRAARVLLILLVLQLGLGIGSYLSRFTPIWIPGGQLTMVVVPVVHRVVASLILAAAVTLVFRACVPRLRSAATSPTVASAGLAGAGARS